MSKLRGSVAKGLECFVQTRSVAILMIVVSTGFFSAQSQVLNAQKKSPQKEVTFGQRTPEIGTTFLQKETTTMTALKDSGRRSGYRRRWLNNSSTTRFEVAGTTAEKITKLKYRQSRFAESSGEDISGETKKEPKPPGFGKTLFLNLKDFSLAAHHSNGKAAKDNVVRHLRSELHEDILEGRLYDPFPADSKVLCGRTFEIGKRYEHPARLKKEKASLLRKYKSLDGKRFRGHSWFRILSLKKSGGRMRAFVKFEFWGTVLWKAKLTDLEKKALDPERYEQYLTHALKVSTEFLIDVETGWAVEHKQDISERIDRRRLAGLGIFVKSKYQADIITTQKTKLFFPRKKKPKPPLEK